MAKDIKKKNRKLRKQIRKTVGALFMVSAIIVAAIPVQDLSASVTTSSTNPAKVQVLNYEDETMKTYDSLDNGTTADLSSAGLEQYLRSTVPYVDPDAEIYTTADGMFQFAFVTPSATASDEVAVILGANVTSLPNGSLTIPSTVDAYKKFTANTTSSGYCAVSRGGKYLYYQTTAQKTDSSGYALYTVPGYNNGSLGEINSYYSGTDGKVVGTQDSAGNWSYNYVVTTTVTDEETGETTEETTEYELVPVTVETWLPCYDDYSSAWIDKADNELYYWSGSSTEYSSSTDSSCFSLTLDKNNQRIHDAQVQYIGRQYIVANPDTTTGASEWVIGGEVTASNPSLGVFSGKGQIVNLTVGDTLLGIGDYAFYGCTGLVSITLGNGLSTIGNGAFADCINMTSCSMQLNSAIAAIGASAFENCQALNNVVIPVNVRVIGDYCFKGCTAMTDIELCGSGQNVALKVIGCDAFVDCSHLASITFPSTYTDYETWEITVDGSAQTRTGIPITYFSGCSSLQYIKIQNTTFTFLEGDLTKTYEDNHKSDLSCDIGVFLNSTVSASFYFEGPDNGMIHTTAKEHSAAFKYLNEDKYEKVVWCPETEYDDEGNIIEGTGHESTFIVNSSNELIDMVIDSECEEIEIPASIGSYGISTIGSTSFQNNCYLRKITIPSTVLYIEANAFKGCHNLEHVIFSEPINIISIGADAFDTQNCSLHSQYCPTGKVLTDEPSLTFTGTISYDSVPFQYAMDASNNINVSSQPVTYITFYSGWPTNLTVRYNADTDKNELIDYPRYDELENYELDSYPYMTEEYVEAAKAAVEAYEKYQSTKKASDLPTEAQLAIVNAALNISLPSGIESIATGIFSGVDENYETVYDEDGNELSTNTKIETITLSSVETIDPYTFANCTALTGVYMSGGEEIGDYAFKNCTSLENVSIAGTVSTLGLRPFAGCSSLTGVSFGSSPYFTCENAIIYGLTNGTKTTIVECLETRGSTTGSAAIGTSSGDDLSGITSIYEEAFKDCDGIGSVDLTDSSISVVPYQCFAQTGRLYSVLLPDTTKSIREGAFWNSNVSYLQIPSSVTYIEPQAFANVDEENDAHSSDGSPKEIALDKDGDPTILNSSSGHATITVYCTEGTAADTYSENYYYINPIYYEPEIYHTVYFWDNYDGTPVLIEEQEVLDGEDAVPPSSDAVPTHSGVTFTGWTTYTNIVRDTDVYAQFSSEVYTVTFMDTISGSVLDIQYVASGMSATPPTPVEYDGYTFTGWAPDYNNITADTIILTQYSDNSSDDNRYTVTFYSYDGTTIVSQQKVSYGESAVAPAAPTRSGYTFAAWVPSTYTKVTSDMNIIATYTQNSSASASASASATATATATPTSSPEVKKYTVSVSGGSGSGSYAAGDIVAINAYYMGDGQLFDKWTTSTAGVGFANASATSTTFTMPAANVAITATYKTGSTSSTTTTSTGSSSTGSTSTGSTTTTSAGSGTTVEITKPGISNTNLAGATVSGSTDNFIVKITEDQTAADSVTAALQAKYGDISRIMYLPMDISLYDSTGRTKIADTTGITVNLTVPLPDDLVQYAGNNKVAAVSNGALEELNAKFTTINGVACVNFTATHFSPYVIYVDTSNLTEATIDVTPKTGDPIHPKWFLALGMACVSLVLFFKRDKAVVNTKPA